MLFWAIIGQFRINQLENKGKGEGQGMKIIHSPHLDERRRIESVWSARAPSDPISIDGGHHQPNQINTHASNAMQRLPQRHRGPTPAKQSWS